MIVAETHHERYLQTRELRRGGGGRGSRGSKSGRGGGSRNIYITTLYYHHTLYNSTVSCEDYVDAPYCTNKLEEYDSEQRI